MELPPFIKLGGNAKPLAGKVLGRLTVLGPVRREGEVVIYLCQCECGTYKEIRAASLHDGRTRSCGCLLSDITRERCTTHGQAPKSNRERSRAYHAWRHMRERCTNKNASDYPRYGGRGITCCEEWAKFENFYQDMGDCPPDRTLDRIDNELGYFADNCRWATKEEQSNNRRNNIHVAYQGETMTLAQAAKKAGFRFHQVYQRMRRGWSFEKSISTPIVTPKQSTKRRPSSAGQAPVQPRGETQD